MRTTRVTLVPRHPVRGGYGLRAGTSTGSIGGHAQSRHPVAMNQRPRVSRLRAWPAEHPVDH
jgi:hypothetical protein